MEVKSRGRRERTATARDPTAWGVNGPSSERMIGAASPAAFLAAA